MPEDCTNLEANFVQTKQEGLSLMLLLSNRAHIYAYYNSPAKNDYSSSTLLRGHRIDYCPLLSLLGTSELEVLGECAIIGLHVEDIELLFSGLFKVVHL